MGLIEKKYKYGTQQIDFNFSIAHKHFGQDTLQRENLQKNVIDRFEYRGHLTIEVTTKLVNSPKKLLNVAWYAFKLNSRIPVNPTNPKA